MREIIKESEVNMSATENVSFRCYRKTSHPQNSTEGQGWTETEINDTLNIYDNTEQRTPTIVIREDDMEEKIAVVRRLTPLECERLQGYPDNYTDIGEWVDSKGKTHKAGVDGPRYKALGNSIALPFWQWLANRITKKLTEDGVKSPTMASLFDGIGGFPLVFTRAGVKPVWASEVEPFCIAVTERRFPNEEVEERNNT